MRPDRHAPREGRYGRGEPRSRGIASERPDGVHLSVLDVHRSSEQTRDGRVIHRSQRSGAKYLGPPRPDQHAEYLGATSPFSRARLSASRRPVPGYAHAVGVRASQTV